MDITLKDKPVNIKDLSLEFPKFQKSTFNPEDYVSDAVLERVGFELNHDHVNWRLSAELAGTFALVFPERFSHFSLGYGAAEALERHLLQLKNNPDPQFRWQNILYPALTARVCFPGRIPLDEETKMQIRTEAEESEGIAFGNGEWGLASVLRIFGELLSVDEIDASQKRAKADRIYHSGVLERARVNDKWDDFINISAAIKLLDLEVAKKIELDPQAWEGMIQSLNQSPTAPSLLWRAMCLKILASERVEITPERINIVMPSTQAGKEAEIVLPTTRKF